MRSRQYSGLLDLRGNFDLRQSRRDHFLKRLQPDVGDLICPPDPLDFVSSFAAPQFVNEVCGILQTILSLSCLKTPSTDNSRVKFPEQDRLPEDRYAQPSKALPSREEQGFCINLNNSIIACVKPTP